MTLKATVAGDTKGVKYTYQLTDAAGTLLSDTKANQFMASASASGNVAISAKGKITVAKGFTPSSSDTKDADNSFRVLVTASTGASSLSDKITIASQAITLGSAAIVKKDGQEYKVVAAGETTLTKDQLDGAYLVVFNAGTEAKTSYTADDIKAAAVSATALTVKYSTKLVTLTNVTTGELAGVAKAIKYTSAKESKLSFAITAADGGKSKTALNKISVIYKGLNQNDGYGLKIETPSTDGTGLEVKNADKYGDETPISFAGDANSTLALTVMRNNKEEGWKTLDSLYNIKVSVKGGKILSSNAAAGTYTVLANKAETTVILTWGKGAEKQTKTYAISNTGAAVKVTKAPKVTVANVTSTKVKPELSFTISGKTVPAAGSAVKIEVDPKQVNNSKAATADLNAKLQTALFGDGVFGIATVGENNTITFQAANGKGTITAGSYKLLVTFGTLANGVFTPSTKSATVKLTSVAGSATEEPEEPTITSSCALATTTATLGYADGGSVKIEFTYDNSSDAVATDLLNTNVNGVANKFRNYFALDTDKQTLSLKTGLSAEDLNDLAKASSKDKKGCIQFTYKDANGDTQTGYGDITVTVAETTQNSTVSGNDIGVNNYNIPDVEVLKQTETDATLTINNGETAAAKGEVLYAVVADGKFAEKDAVVSDDSTITVSSKTVDASDTAESITVKLIPAASAYADSVKELYKAYDEAAAGTAKTAAEKAFKDAVKAYGLTVTTSVKVLARNTTEDKISIAEADRKVTVANSDYNQDDLAYETGVSYEKLLGVDPTTVTGTTAQTYGIVSFAVDADSSKIVVKVDKAKLDDEAAKTTPAVTYGDTLAITATVNFATPIKSQTFDFEITLPEKASTTAAQAVTAVKNAKDSIEKTVVSYSPAYDSTEQVLTLTNETPTEEQLADHPFLAITVWEAIKAVREQVEALVPADSNVKVNMTQLSVVNASKGTSKITLASDDFTKPVDLKEGTLKIGVQLTDATGTNTGVLLEQIYELTVEAVTDNPENFSKKLNEFVKSGYKDEALNLTIDNDITKEDIEAAAKQYLELDKYTTLSLATENDTKVEATEAQNGYITGTLVLSSTADETKKTSAKYEIKIDKLQTLTTAKTAIKAALDAMNDDGKIHNDVNKTLRSEVLQTAKDAINNSKISVDIAEVTKDATYTDGDGFAIKNATRDQGSGDQSGTLNVTFKLTYEGQTPVTYEITEKFAALKSATNAETAVKAVVGSTAIVELVQDAVKNDGADEDDIKNLILDKAQDALKYDSIKVTFKKDSSNKDDFTYKAPTYLDGSINFTLVLTGQTSCDDGSCTDTHYFGTSVAYKEVQLSSGSAVTIGAIYDEDDQTLEDAEKDCITELDGAIADYYAVYANSGKLTGSAVGTYIQAELKKQIVNDNIEVTVSEVKDTDITAPTAKARGSIKVTFQVKDTKNETSRPEVTHTVVIDNTQYTVSAVTEAVENLTFAKGTTATGVSTDADDDTYFGDTEAKNAILAAAQKAVNSSLHTVSYADDVVDDGSGNKCVFNCQLGSTAKSTIKLAIKITSVSDPSISAETAEITLSSDEAED
jgi:hypothetical protein